MRIRRLIPALAVLSLLASCQKELGFVEDAENNGNNNPGSNIDIIGTWRFAGIYAVTGTTAEFTESGISTRMEAQLEYTGSNNIGTVTFTNNQMTTTGVGYDANGTMRTRTFIGGVLVDESTDPFVQNTPPTSSSGTYVRNTSDSITLSQSPFDYDMGSVPPLGDVETGAKFRKSNDTLYMRIRMNDDFTLPDPTTPMTMKLSVYSEVALVKP